VAERICCYKHIEEDIEEEVAMHTGSTSGEDLRDFERFLERREEAARAFVSGEAAPLGRIVARVLPATFFGPRGG
jgi:hypothetical protein